MASSPLFALPEPAAADLAWLFPGQGAQATGMGADLWRSSDAARAVYDEADAVLGYKLSEICFESPEERLRETYFSQPAIMTTSLACLAAALERGLAAERPAFMAGHSVGEFSALVAAGALSLADGLCLVQERARLMAAASEATPGTLAAIIGLDEPAVSAICAAAGADVCNRNLPAQTVVGGSGAAVARAITLAKERGAQRAVGLSVSGAFHSHLMTPAVAELTAAVERTPIAPPTVPVVANLAAVPLESAAAWRDELVHQIVQPVRWHESVSFIAGAGVSRFIEFGPGRVLTGLVRRIVTGADLVNVSGLGDLTQAEGSAVGRSA